MPESLARVTETLWLRAIDEARERTKVSSMSKTPSQQALAAMESRVTELTAALADSRARGGEMESQLLTSLRERIELREQVRQLTAMLKAEQELRAQDQGKSNAEGRELRLNDCMMVAPGLERPSVPQIQRKLWLGGSFRGH